MAVKLSPPWNTYNNMVRVLFDVDPEITVGNIYKASEEDQNEYTYAFEIATTNKDKFVALNKLMDQYITFGNVIVKQVIIDNSGDETNPYIELYENLFNGNPNLKDIKSITDPAGRQHHYIRFQPEVLQFYNDDLTDYNGNKSCLAEDIAYEMFSNNMDSSINFCTADIRENDDPDVVNAPLGEWP